MLLQITALVDMGGAAYIFEAEGKDGRDVVLKLVLVSDALEEEAMRTLGC
jgi:hypothetical protein